MTIITKNPDSERLILTAPYDGVTWHELRRQGIGASDIPAVAGISRYRGPWDVWASKVDGTEWEGTDDTHWGQFIEGRIIDWWAAGTDLNVANGGLYRHPEVPFVMASPDAVVVDDWQHRQPVAVVDAKNAGWYMANEWANDEAPVEYVAQITWQMLAAGVKKGYLVASMGGKAPTPREFDYDDELAAELLVRATRFWKLVEDRTPPPIDGTVHASKWLASRYPDADPDMIRNLDPVDVAALRELVDVKRRIKELERLQKERENQIKARLGDAAYGQFEGREMVRWTLVDRAGYEVKPTTYRKLHIPKAVEKELSPDGND
jgi:putative phage-type endonuclease